MKAFFRFLKSTFLRGFVFLLPLIVVGLILQQTVVRLAKIVKPIAEWIQVKAVVGIEMPYLIALLLLLLLGFLGGLLAQTKLGSSFRSALDRWLSGHIPGYVSTKKKTKSMVGSVPEPRWPAVLVKVGETWRFGLLHDRPHAGWSTVFLPNAPAANTGMVILVSDDQVKPLNVDSEALNRCLGELGAGSEALLGTEVRNFLAPK